MSSRKKRKKDDKKLRESDGLVRQIELAVRGLTYQSETDAAIKVFSGQKADSVSLENVLSQIGSMDSKIEEKEFNAFFEPLIKSRDWFGDDERKKMENYIVLKNLLQINLIEKKVFRIGKIKIDIFVLGLDKDNTLCGIQTKAVET